MSILTYPALYTDAEFDVLTTILSKQKRKQSFNVIICSNLVQTFKLFNDQFCRQIVCEYKLTETQFDDILFDFYQKLAFIPIERQTSHPQQLNIQLQILNKKHKFTLQEMLGAVLDTETASHVIQLQPVDILD